MTAAQILETTGMQGPFFQSICWQAGNPIKVFWEGGRADQGRCIPETGYGIVTKYGSWLLKLLIVEGILNDQDYPG